MTSRSSKTKRNPSPSPTGTRFGFLLFGTGNRGRATCRGFDLAVVSSKEYAAHILSCVCLALLRRSTKKDNLWLSFSVGTGNRGRWTCHNNKTSSCCCPRMLTHSLREELALLPIAKRKTAARAVFLFGTGNRGRTCTVTHRILNPARLPIPPYPHNTNNYIIKCAECQRIYF